MSTDISRANGSMSQLPARLRADAFDYPLPQAAIAQVPAEPRDASRLLVLDRGASTPGAPRLSHHRFRDLTSLLRPGDLLVVNDSRVMPARLRGERSTGAAVEVVVLRELPDARWEALVRPSRRLEVGERITLSSGDRLEVGERLGEGMRAIRFMRDAWTVMDAAGEMPLPPYIHDRSSAPERYQTVYADPRGSAAAPTAGLHFTPQLLEQLEAMGVRRAAVTLHVGLDTFRPLDGEFVDQHTIHREWYAIPAATRRSLQETRDGGGRIVAIGTTTVRVLETAAHSRAASGWADLYITPPHAFTSVDALITNFHLPRSSLLVLVTAFVGNGMQDAAPLEARDTLLAAYGEALGRGYRFYSFGDAMLII
jgi:S-adenosylmethionine:tRNA ribosyltransferase-isomerase